MEDKKNYFNDIFNPQNNDLLCQDETGKKYCYIKRAFAEVYQILCHSEKELFKCIPESFMCFLKDRMDLCWRGGVDFSKSLNNMNLLREIRIILSLVYRDFVCSEKERQRLIEEDMLELKRMGENCEICSLRDYFEF